MKQLLVLRHSLTRKGVDRSRAGAAAGSHLSVEGVRLAREVGQALPEPGYVMVGDQPRHLETALALGFAVDEQVGWPSGYVSGEVDHHEQWAWDRPFARYADLLATGRGLAAMAATHLAHWQRALTQVPEGGTALVVSSGGSIEPVLVAALPGSDHAGWGSALHHLEGAVLDLDAGAFTTIRFRRRP